METYILRDKISDEVCDLMVKHWEINSPKSKFDKLRGYNRLTDRAIENQDVINRYNSELKVIEAKYREKYPFINQGTSWGLMSPFNIQKYDPGHAYNPVHIEDGGPVDGKYQRLIAFTTYLNDVNEGGETEFPLHGIKVKPQKGLTIIWPAGWTHPHRGIPAPNETKYIATGWFSYYFKGKEIK